MRKLETLVDQIKINAQFYYDGVPVITDEEFDLLVEELTALDPFHPLLKTPGWGYVPKTVGLEKVKHQFPVLGLPKLKHQDFLKNKCLPFPFLFMVSLKLDGGSAVAYYKNGMLVNVVSRGDGTTGLDITKNLLPGNTVPIKLRNKSTLAVRGEVIITAESLAILGGSNARNVAVGLSQSLHKSDEELQHLKFVAYDIPTKAYDKDDIMCTLSDNNFLVVPHSLYKEKKFYYAVRDNELSLSNTTSLLHRNGSRLSNEGLPADGLVLTRNELAGSDDNRSIAYKFDDERAETMVKNVVWKASRTGRVVPVIEVEPVMLSGAVIKRVTMNNAYFLVESDAGIGSTIEIVRSNMVIPKWVKTNNPAPVILPTKCHSCGSTLVLRNRDLNCLDETCEAKNAGGRKAFWDMVKPDGIGPAIIEQLEDYGHLYSFQEILRWVETYIPFESTASDRLVNKMVENVKEFTPTFGQILAMANIPQIGEKVQKALDTPDTFEYFKILKLADLPKMEWKKKMNRPAWDNLNQCWYKITELLSLFKLRAPELLPEGEIIKVCLTGALSKPRPVMLQEWAKNGVVEASAAICDVLVTDESSRSNKYLAAIKRGIPILTEKAFVEKYLS